MKKLSLKAFLNHFCDDQRKERKFCFILGAGASKQSGIRTGGELAEIWMREIDENLWSRQDR